MANPVPCTPCAPTTLTTNVPGAIGSSAVTLTTANFTIPGAIGSTVTISVGDTSWITSGKNLFIGGANFVVTGIGSPTSMTIKYLGMPGDAAINTVVASGAVVAPGLGNYTVPVTANGIAALVDSTGGTPGTALAAVAVRSTIVLGPFSMALLVNNQLWQIAIPYAFTVVAAAFRCDVAVTTGAKAATFQVQVNSVNTTGGQIVVAGAQATGAAILASAISGANVGVAGNGLGVIVSGVTTFTEGYGHIELTVTNKDLANTISSIASNLNAAIAALV